MCQQDCQDSTNIKLMRQLNVNYDKSEIIQNYENLMTGFVSSETTRQLPPNVRHDVMQFSLDLYKVLLNL
jgi:glutaredoxin-related protein